MGSQHKMNSLFQHIGGLGVVRRPGKTRPQPPNAIPVVAVCTRKNKSTSYDLKKLPLQAWPAAVLLGGTAVLQPNRGRRDGSLAEHSVSAKSVRQFGGKNDRTTSSRVLLSTLARHLNIIPCQRVKFNEAEPSSRPLSIDVNFQSSPHDLEIHP